jgi:Replication-relaxation
MSPRLYDSRLEELDEKLLERERAAISVLLEMRFLSTRQVERWVFDGSTPLARARASRRSIAKLVELGIIRHLERRIGGVRAGSAGHINVLTPLGLRLAAFYGWITFEQARRTREPGGQFVRHYLAVAEAHLRVVEAQARDELEVLERQAEPAAWREFTGPSGARAMLKPDAFFALGFGSEGAHWFLEVDRATVGGATLDRKLSTYVDYWNSAREVLGGGVSLKVLWLAPDTHRLDQLQQAFRRTPAETRDLFRGALFDDLMPVLTNEDVAALDKRHPTRMPKRHQTATREAV